MSQLWNQPDLMWYRSGPREGQACFRICCSNSTHAIPPSSDQGLWVQLASLAVRSVCNYVCGQTRDRRHGKQGLLYFFPFLRSKCLSLVGKVPSITVAAGPSPLPVFSHDRRNRRRLLQHSRRYGALRYNRSGSHRGEVQ